MLSRARAGIRGMSRKERERRRNLHEDQRETIAFYKDRDPEENRETAPPDDETVILHCAWAVEFYTPAHMDDLIKNLLHFNRASSLSERDAEHLDSWIEQFHRVAYGGGSANLGVWERKGLPKRFVGPTRVVDMPATVAYALATAYRISPSIMCIAVCFVFEDDFSTSFDTALRKSRATYTQPNSSGFLIITPKFQKTDEVALIRSRISADFTCWFRNNIPGIFASRTIASRVPICEFVTLQKATPFPARENDGTLQPSYLGMLGLDSGWDAWRHSEVPELHFSIQREQRGSLRHYSTLSANEPGFLDRIGNYGGHEGQFAQILYMNDGMADLFCLWSGLALFDVFTEMLSKVRNSGGSSVGQSGNSVEDLQRLQDQIFSLTDIGAVSTEFSNEADAMDWGPRSTGLFVPCEPDRHAPNDTLLTVFRRLLAERATWLLRTESTVSDQLVQMGAIINASENVRLQQVVAKLTRWVVLLTAVAVVIGALQLFGTDWVSVLLNAIGEFLVATTMALPR